MIRNASIGDSALAGPDAGPAIPRADSQKPISSPAPGR
jgi:hypothetical protein